MTQEACAQTLCCQLTCELLSWGCIVVATFKISVGVQGSMKNSFIHTYWAFGEDSLQAGRLAGVGHKAEFEAEHCIGMRPGVIYQVVRATLLEQLQQGSHAGSTVGSRCLRLWLI